MLRIVTSVIAVTVMAVPSHALTAEEIQEISAKVGMPLQVGYAIVSKVDPKPQVTQPPVVATARPPVVEQETPRRSSPTLIDLSKPPAGYVPRPYVPDPGAYSAKLEARALKIFGYNREEERQRWMAEQEQREIANQINASKPLLVPVNSR
jgi:hypothetical protein